MASVICTRLFRFWRVERLIYKNFLLNGSDLFAERAKCSCIFVFFCAMLLQHSCECELDLLYVQEFRVRPAMWPLFGVVAIVRLPIVELS